MSTAHSKSGLSFIYWNCQGIRSKVDELNRFLKNTLCDVVCLNETFLKYNNRLHIPGFTCIRKDRESGRFGGLAILVRNGLKYNEILCPATNLVECMGIDISCNNSKLILINAYLPGASTPSAIRSHYHRDLVALTSFRDAFIICGDLNSKHVNWNCPTNNLAGMILESVSSNHNFFVEYPSSFTYCPMSVHFAHSTIDIVLTNSIIPLRSIETKQLFSSDHFPVLCNAGMTIEYERVVRFNYFKADWITFRNEIEKQLDSLFRPLSNTSDVDRAVDEFLTIILRAQSIAIPQQHNGPDGIFIDDHTKFLINLRNTYRRRFLRYFDPLDNSICIYLKKLINKSLFNLRNIRWETKLRDCDQNHTDLFKLAKSLKRKNTHIPPLQGIASDADKATIIADVFEKNHDNPLKNKFRQHTADVTETVTYNLSRINHGAVGNEILSYPDVALEIKKLKNSKTPGEDKISPRLLKNLPNRAIFVLTHIFNMCLFFNYFPCSWKSAIVFPLLKPGKPASDPISYRPISLLSVIGKLFERLILIRISSFISLNSLYPDSQFGFRKYHSTALQILRVINNVRSNFRRGQSTGLLTFDVEKAFDRVWHNGLLYKLLKLNFPAYLVKLISSFLYDRTFHVKVGNSMSSPRKFCFGVPQGAVLSPALYNLYVSDMPTITDCQLALFADDTALITSSKLYKTVKKRLEKGSRQLSKYFSKWKILLNNNKTEAIFFTRRRRRQKPRIGDCISIGGHSVLWKNCIRYLGCLLDSRLTLREHVSKSIVKSIVSLKCMYPLINRKSVLSKKIKNNMYKLYFRPILTYPNIVLSQTSVTNLRRVQIQQNKFLRLVNCKPYYTRISTLHKEAKTPMIADHIAKCVEKAILRSECCENLLVQNIFELE